MAKIPKKLEEALPPELREQLSSLRKSDAERLAGQFALQTLGAIRKKQSPTKPVDVLVNFLGFAVSAAAAEYLPSAGEVRKAEGKGKSRKPQEPEIIDAEFRVIKDDE